MKYKYVYVAGPISKGDTLLNIRAGIDTGAELVKLGYAPYVPHNDFIQYMIHPEVMSYERLLEWDFDWIERCDALLRLPGESAGSDREVAFALSRGISVFKSVEDLESANGRSTD